ncbi:MAG: hypothetical protein ABEJ73_11365 [Haloplanus sp.]
MPHASVAPAVPGAASTVDGVVGRAAFLLAFAALVLALLAFQFATVRALYGGDESTEQRVTCPSCGARTAVGSVTCDYCGERVDGTEE